MSCQERVHNRFRYLGEQHDPVTQQYYLKARYYNPVIARFTQEDTYYGDGLNLYQSCANNPVRYKDPSGHCAIDQNAYQRYLDVGADTETAKVAAELYPNLSSKLDIVKKYQSDGYNVADDSAGTVSSSRYYDFKYRTKYERVTDYISGKKSKVKGDKYMYSIKNTMQKDYDMNWKRMEN